MMGKSRIEASAALALIVLFCGAIIMVPGRAEAKVVAVEGMGYNVQAGMKDNLTPLVGKKVQLTLASGATFTGLVRQVGDHVVHVEKLDGNEFFDALIRIDTIEAITARFRTVK